MIRFDRPSSGFVMLERGPELARAWDRMARLVAAEDRVPFVPCTAPERCEDETCPLTQRHRFEAWQYMGTGYDRDRGTWSHDFRHRCHPTTNARRLVRVPAITGWTPDGAR